MAGALGHDGIHLRLGVEVQTAGQSDEGIFLRLAGGDTLQADRVLIAAGRKPNLAGLGMDSLEVDDHCRVGDHVWAAGDVTGIAPYTHTANYQAGVVGGQPHRRGRGCGLPGDPARRLHRAAVWCIGVLPEEDHALLVAGGDIADTARAAITGATGRVEVYGDRHRGVLVGAAAIGTDVDEWMGEVALAIRAEVPLAVLADLVHAFPTWARSSSRCSRSSPDVRPGRAVGGP